MGQTIRSLARPLLSALVLAVVLAVLIRWTPISMGRSVQFVLIGALLVVTLLLLAQVRHAEREEC